MTELRIDFETRSDVDLRKRGAGPYFESPHFKVLIAAWSIDGGPVKTWTYGHPCPGDIRAAVEAGCTVRAFNASFERQCFNVLAAREGWPRPALDRYRCTAAEAAAMALPRSLDGVGEALGLPVRKDKRGTALIRKFSIPRRARKGENPLGLYWNEPEDHPDEFAEFVAYCAQDVATEAAAAARLMPLSDYEQAVYALDQQINDRGIRIDITSARAALELAEKAKAILDREMTLATGGAVTACSQVAKLTEWVQAQDVPMTSAAKADLEDLLHLNDLPAKVRRAVEIRQEAAKTSVSKLKAMIDRASADGRVRNGFLYCAAGTRRWSSPGVNFANMPRPRKIYEDAKLNQEALFRAIRHADPDVLPLLYGDALGRPLHLISDAIRGFVWSAPGHDLIQADYAGIEGAVIAWLSGEEWKLAALREIAADPSLPDLYRRTAAAIMGTTTDVIHRKHPLRQSVGKVSELALGFGGGVSAFFSMARMYGVDLDALHGPVWEAADEERRERALLRYAACLSRKDSKTDVLSRDAWVACELIKAGWRASNPAISGSWKLLEGAIRTAIQNPGTVATAARVDYLVARGFLWARLPSGGCLAYGNPRLKDQVWAERLVDGAWAEAEVVDRDLAEKMERTGTWRIKGPTSPKATAVGVNAVTKKWERFGLYGGLVAENNTQTTARDLLVSGMFNAEAAGYPIIGHVYDEIIAEVPRGWGDVAEFERVICELPPWAEGLPLTASGWRGKRYRKD